MIPVVPLPSSIHPLPGSLRIPKEPSIAIFGPGSEFALDLLGAELLSSDRALERPTYTVEIDAAFEGGAEGYQLGVSAEGVVFRAATPTGAFYAIQTWFQISRGLDEVPAVEIVDRPRLAWRGFMLDSSRHFQDAETVKRLLDAMSILKLNVFHWHLTDDGGWRIQIDRFPKLTEVAAQRGEDELNGSGFYTKDQIREIVAYAKQRHITVVPEIEMPAHTTEVMAAYPELSCTGEVIDHYGIGMHHFTEATDKRIFCAGNEEVFRFLEGVLDEVIDLFDSPVVHLGGDERPEGFWSRCPKCRAVMEREGFTSESELQHWFMARLISYVHSKGRRTMAWTPTLDHGAFPNHIAQDWFFDFVPAAIELGMDAVNSRDRFVYFDYPNFAGRQKPNWMPDLPLERVYGFNPMPAEVPETQRSKMLGTECALWTEMIEDRHIGPAVFPRLLAFAEAAWTEPERKDFDAFVDRAEPLRPVIEDLGFSYPVGGPEPITLERPAVVTTSMQTEGPFVADAAFDGSFVRYFHSAANPKEGDWFAITLDEPVMCDGVTVYSGSDWAYEDYLRGGHLEVVGVDGLHEVVASVDERRTDARFSPRLVKEIRLVVTCDQPTRLAIRSIVLRPVVR